jgi:hypothetical protein
MFRTTASSVIAIGGCAPKSVRTGLFCWRKEDSNPRSLSRATRLGHICRGSNVAYERDRTPFLQPNFPMPLERSYSEDTRGSVFLVAYDLSVCIL